LLYVTAKRKLDSVIRIFERNGFPFVEDTNILPNSEDQSTYFMCSGMQRCKNRFREPDCTSLSSMQSCIRTNDIEQVGDGTHLTYFQMLGNFSFKGIEYQQSVEMWDEIVKTLGIEITSVHVHPESFHHSLWRKLKYTVIDDVDCVWSDGDIGGYCCELYNDSLGHSTDVGFGWERMVQVIEGKSRVDETSLFDQRLSPVCRDHVRTLESLWHNGIEPYNKGRGYVVRKLLRRILNEKLTGMLFQPWLDQEYGHVDRKLEKGRKFKEKYKNMTDEWWWDSFGITPDERKLL
jgi:alanyl-tRNA synthetase